MKKLSINSALILTAITFLGMTALGGFCLSHLIRNDVSSEQRWPAIMVVVGCVMVDYMLSIAIRALINMKKEEIK